MTTDTKTAECRFRRGGSSTSSRRDKPTREDG